MEIAAPPIDLGVLAPLLVVLTGAFIILLVDLFLPPERRALLGYLAVVTALVAIGACVPLWDVQRRAYYDMVTVDRFAVFASIAILAGTALALLLSIDYLASQGLHLGEYYPLVLISASGMLIMAIGNDLVVVFLGFELLSLALYVLSGFARGHAASEESALKYFLLGSFSFGFLVYGTSLIYGASGTTNFTGLSNWLRSDGRLDDPLLLAGLALILVAFAFKLALAPFHMWTPDVYVGAPTSVTAFMSVGTKVAAFAALARLLVEAVPGLGYSWVPVVWTLAVVTMLVGNLGAVTQRNVKRMLAYSSIGQAGYVLIGVVAAGSQVAQVRQDALGAILFYLLAYTFMNLGAFAVIVALARPGYERLDLEQDFAGLAQRRPWLAAAMTLFMLSLGGVPPTAGFMGKLMLFRAAVEAGHWPLALVGVLTSVVALAFYLRVVIQMYARDSAVKADEHLRVPAPLAVVLAVCVLLTLQFGILPALPLDLAQQALVGVLP